MRISYICKTDSFNYILKTPANIYGRSIVLQNHHWNVIKTDVLEEQDRLTFFTVLPITEISCCYRLVAGGKAGKEIPEPSRSGFLEMISANNSPNVEDNTSRPFNRGGIAGSRLFRALLVSTLLKVRRTKFLKDYRLLVLLSSASLAAL